MFSMYACAFVFGAATLFGAERRLHGIGYLIAAAVCAIAALFA